MSVLFGESRKNLEAISSRSFSGNNNNNDGNNDDQSNQTRVIVFYDLFMLELAGQ